MDKKETAQNTSKGISDGNLCTTKRGDANRFSPESQCFEILSILQTGKSLTHYEAAQMGIIGFNARIFDLRHAGYHIICTMQEHINKHGKAVKRGIYTLAVDGGVQ